MSDQVEQREYFISYNSVDAEYAQALSDALDAAGIEHHFAGKDLPFGKNIAVWMDDALMGSTRALALCSPDYFKPEAKYSEAERAAVFWTDPVGAKARLVPI